MIAIPDHIIAHFKSEHPNFKNIDIAIEELSKFLYLRSKCPGRFINVTKEIDELWHSFILQTRDYFSYCESLPSGEYIHHKTLPYAVNFQTNFNRFEFYFSCANDMYEYIKLFGIFDEKSVMYWGFPKYIIENDIMTLKGLNDIELWQQYTN